MELENHNKPNVIPLYIEAGDDCSDIKTNFGHADIIMMLILINMHADEGDEWYEEVNEELMSQGPVLKAKTRRYGEEYFRLRDDKLEHVVSVLVHYGFIYFNEETGVIEKGELL